MCGHGLLAMLWHSGTYYYCAHLYIQKLNVKRVATGYGQPPSTFYDWTLAPSGAHEPSFRLSDDVYGRLLIEKFSNKVTKALYSNRLDPVGLVSDDERSVHTIFLSREYEDLEQKLQLDGSCTSLFPCRLRCLDGGTSLQEL